MTLVHLRTGWLALLVWVLSISATMASTVFAVKGLYDTPAKIRTYADAVRGNALMMINGHVAGLDSLGGIVANEFGFLASFVIPFMALSLITRMTRKNEELGRLEAVLAGRIARSTPLVSAVLVALAAELVVSAVFFACLAGAGTTVGGAALYAASMGLLGLVFVGIAAVAAQLVEHARGVYALGLGALIAAYLLRGVGDVQWSPLTWLSPLGWQEETRAFGTARWWPLLIPLATAVLLVVCALVLADRRDVGSALFGVRRAAPTASPFLRTPLGIALRTHRGSMAGWAVATAIVAATFGSVAQALVDAIRGNPDLALAMGASGITGVDAVLAMTGLILALMSAGYVVQAVGVLRAEETSGRLEVRLSGDRDRSAWLTTHLAVIATGLVVVSAAGGGALALSATASVGHSVSAPVLRAVLSFLPAVLFFAALALAVFAVVPRWGGVVWAGYAAAAVIAYLGDPLRLASAVRNLSPFHLIGNPPVTPAPAGHVLVLCGLAAAGLVTAYRVFGRRGIPAG